MEIFHPITRPGQSTRYQGSAIDDQYNLPTRVYIFKNGDLVSEQIPLNRPTRNGTDNVTAVEAFVVPQWVRETSTYFYDTCKSTCIARFTWVMSLHRQ